MAGRKFVRVKGHLRNMPKPSKEKEEKKRMKEEKEKKLRAEYRYRVKIGAHRNLPYEEWKKWYLHNE